MASLTPNTKEEQDAAYSPEQRAKALHAAEQRAAFDRDFENPERLAKDGAPGDLAGGARKKEEAPSANWRTKLSGASMGGSESSGGKQKKRKGPIIAIVSLLGIGGAGGAGLFGAFSLLPLNITSNAFNKEDAQSTSMTIRTETMINVKIVKGVTSGVCTNLVELMCKYSRPSNRLLTNLAKNGIQARNADGTPTKSSSGPFPNERPTTYSFTDRKTGASIDVDAKEFRQVMKTNAAFRSAIHAAYNPRVVGYLDSVFEKIKVRFGFRARDDLSDTKDGDEVNDKLNENSEGEDNGTKAAADGSSSSDDVGKKLLTEAAQKEVRQIGKSARGNLFGAVAGIVCGVGNIPGLTIRVVRAYQMAQLVAYSATIIKGIYAWKAGDSSPEAVTAIGNLFTKVVGGRSAMDSFGMKNLLFGDTAPADDSYKKYSPGSGVIENLGDISQITSSNEKVQACRVATNPATGLAIDAATSPTLIGPVIQFVGGLAASVALENLAPLLIEKFIALMPKGFFAGILDFLVGDLTRDLVGESLGNAFISGAVHMMGQTANAGGNMALTVNQKLAYNKVTEQVNLAYAEEDRATLSPFDATNPNTMLGSLVNQLVPYYSKMGTLGGVVSTIGSIVTGSIGRLSTVSAASDAQDPKQYQMCDDPSIKDIPEPIAAGPFCNIQYGIPPEYLDIDPQTIVADLVAKGDIDKNTGEPIDKSNVFSDLNPDQDEKGTASLKGWIDLCMDGTTAQAENCKITDATSASYALYVIDHRIQQTMDGEDKILDGEFPASSSSGAREAGSTSDPASISVVVNKKNPINPKNYVPAGLTDIGGGYQLQSEAAAAYGTMAAAAASSGIAISPISAYRSYDKQVTVYAGWVNSLGQEAADLTSARPGFSEHQTGLAVDINSLEQSFANTPEGRWLTANAYKYGFILRYPKGQTPTTGYEFEPWHYRYIGVAAATEMRTKGIINLEEYYKVEGGNYAYSLSRRNVAILNKRYGLI